MDQLPNLSRREALQGTLLAGAAFLLAGCQSSPVASLPDPTWPDQGPFTPGNPGGMTPLPPGSIPVQPQPQPQPYQGSIAVLSRSRWTGTQPMRTRETYAMNGVGRITVHHDAIESAGLSSPEDAIRRLNSVRDGHLRRGMVDIGYHYVIDPAGRVWEARPLQYQGGHVHNQNEHNLGVMVMGNFDRQRPSSQALATLDAFVAEQMKRFSVPLSRVYTHQEIGSSACPGVNLQAYMVRTRTNGALARLRGAGYNA